MAYCTAIVSLIALTSWLAGCGGDDERPMTMPPTGVTPGVPDAEHGPSVDGDIDGDGVPDDEDNCPSIANADQREACTYPIAPTLTGEVVADGVERINWHRRRVGLGGVSDDPAATRGCELHVAYLRQTAEDMGRPVLSHEEDPTSPYYTEEGAAAGVNAVLSLGQSDITLAVDGWINTLYHRLPLLHPGLATVGVAYDGGLACVEYRSGTDSGASAPHPIFYPPADIDTAEMTFTGNESPCPTVEDPLAGGSCPFSATIPSVGLHGMGALGAVATTYTNLDSGEAVEIFQTWYDGGPSPHEMMGYVRGSVAIVPLPETTLERAAYEVRVDATVGGAAQTFRWRFRTTPAIPGGFGCDPTGEHRTFEDAMVIRPGERVAERVCDEPDMFLLETDGPGLHRVEIHTNPELGDLDMVAYRPDGVEFARTAGEFEIDWLEVEGGYYLEVVGRAMAMNDYLIVVL